jgi:hypothetical protein
VQAKQDSSGHLKKPDSSQVSNKPSSGTKKTGDGKRKAESSPRSTDEKKKKRETENLVPPGTGLPFYLLFLVSVLKIQALLK